MPETVLKNLKTKIPKQWVVCFLSALIIGFCAHLYKMTGWIPNWDSLVFRYDAQNMISMGRWFLPVACGLSSYYDLPFLNGLLAILFHGMGAVCICHIFHVKKHITAALIGGVVVAFPTMTSVMMYNYVADGYAISFFLACLAAMFLTQGKSRYILSAVLLALSVGIYQAYITVTVVLLLLYLIDCLIFSKAPVAKLVKKSVLFLITGVFGAALYYLVLQGLLFVTGETLLDYQGVSAAASMTGIDIWSALYVIRHAFTDVFLDFSKGVHLFPLINCFILALTAAGYLLGAVKNRGSMSFVKWLLLAVYVVCMPIGAAILAIVNPHVDYHNLMKMGYCVFYVAFILLYERLGFSQKKISAGTSWLVLGVSCVLMINQIVIANVSYHKAQMAYEKSYGTLIRIADRIEQTELAETCEEILVIGALPGSESYSVNLPPEVTGVTDSYILRADDDVVGQSVLCSAINDYCGTSYRFLAGERKQELLKMTTVQEMSLWPAEDCVKVIEQVIVIKLGVESES